MIEDPQVVKETRKVRCAISERFGNDFDRYIDYLISQEAEDEMRSKPHPETAVVDKETAQATEQ